ncbi:unnamed protein product [Phytophthora fragariaefolia]|uniref:Unnamed protein product n=1 Tax=Phytophthora fragariaefolia TaxID=1490495 RepID=A0A9W6XP17_9STRA|nr:unnamed protein product [Phytophthora fragariaefolia]
MVDSIWDLQKALRFSSRQIEAVASLSPNSHPVSRTPRRPRRRTSPRPADSDATTFGRHHPVQTTPRPVVSKALRDQIIDRINRVHDPFIGSSMSQDNDEYDEMNVEERARCLPMTPPVRLPMSKTEPVPPMSHRCVASTISTPVRVDLDDQHAHSAERDEDAAQEVCERLRPVADHLIKIMP